YHPVLLTKLLLYAYCEGVVSSRAIAAKTYTDVAFRVLAADQHPDFRTISDFRERHLSALTALFVQVVRLAGRLGLTKLEHVAQDGSKILANASKHRAMSYARMQQAEERLGREIQTLLAAAQAVDAAEDAAHGADRSGDEPPPDLGGEVARRERRLATIRQAKAALEAEARAEAEAIRAADAAERQRRAAAGERQKPGKVPQPKEEPADTAQRNFTDPASRIMPNADKAFVQAYNGQIAVDAGGDQIIVGCLLTNQSADPAHLAPMLDRVQAVTGRVPGEWSADAGYFSADNIAAVERAGGIAYIPPDRPAHGAQAPPAVARLLATGEAAPPASVVDDENAVKAAMRARLATEAGRRAYGRRKQTVEPVFGQLKERRGLRRFLLRGLEKVRAEWTLWCLTHNLLKLVRALRRRPALRQRLAA
ncbi:MAG TPA: transposase, partial [Thermomicrobiales bacterium]|nr:transposase [Thermomicrobiales bacterium]